MKKIFIALVISSVSFVACNSGANSEAKSGDSSAAAAITPDSAKAPVTVSTDTMVNLDTNAAVSGAAHHVDSSAKK
ncbi:hypothetical protein [Niabella soli]|uniref:Entericidin n=1 Tax=Niabella soli DSM 19437 TaxID=929713 RepID=W0F6P8_9BACT|nr:hypothetical protein [Niabella soli]AHF17051.1 hypothetical protein NIASO_00925 [Niabella soli DSM 19437]